MKQKRRILPNFNAKSWLRGIISKFLNIWKEVLQSFVIIFESSASFLCDVFLGIFLSIRAIGRFIRVFLFSSITTAVNGVLLLCKKAKQTTRRSAKDLWSKFDSWLKEKITPAQEAQKKRHLRRQLRQLLGIFYIGVPLFDNLLADLSFDFVIYICQFISFFTTWAGAAYYISNFARVIPGVLDASILFALVIQLTIIKLSRKGSAKKSGRQWLLLVFFTVVSICLSYVGTVNAVRKPYEGYSIIYEHDVYSNVDTLKKEIINGGGDISRIASHERLAAQASTVYLEIINQANNLGDDTANNIKAAIGDFKFSKKDVLDTLEKPNGYETLTDAYNNLIQAARANHLTRTAQDYLGQDYYTWRIPLEQRFTAYDTIATMSILHASDIQRGYTDIKNFEGSQDDLAPASNDSTEPTGSTKPTASTEPTVNNELATSAEENDGEEFGKSPNSKVNAHGLWNKFVSWLLKMRNSDETVDEYDRIVEGYANVAQEYYQEFNQYFSKKNLTDKPAIATALNTINDAAETFRDKDSAHVVAFTAIKSDFGKVIIPLLFALFFDGVTFAFALVGEYGRIRPLRVKSSRDNMKSEEALLEQVFLSVNPGFIEKTLTGSGNLEEYVNDCRQMILNTLVIIRDYLNLFSISPETRVLGYALKTVDKSIVTNEKFSRLTSVLHQRGYLIRLTYDEYKRYLEESDLDAEEYLNKQEPNAPIPSEYFFLKNRARDFLQQSITGNTVSWRLLSAIDSSDNASN